MLNYGASGATIVDSPFYYRRRYESRYQRAIESNADLYLVQFGTNDAFPERWNETVYRSAMHGLIDELEALGSIVVLMVPPPYVLEWESLGDPTQHPVNLEIPFVIPDIARERKLTVINNYELFGNYTAYNPAWYDLPSDGVHPNGDGYLAMAQHIRNILAHDVWPRYYGYNLTHVPSYAPTPLPTPVPTLTFRPTSVPTPAPVYHPTALPTPVPSFLPTAIPTTAQPTTSRPSAMPTPVPSEFPSSVPSSAPSMLPTPVPSELPSACPSPAPTFPFVKIFVVMILTIQGDISDVSHFETTVLGLFLSDVRSVTVRSVKNEDIGFEMETSLEIPGILETFDDAIDDGSFNAALQTKFAATAVSVSVSVSFPPTAAPITPPRKKKKKNILVYVLVGVFGGAGILCAVLFILRRHQYAQDNDKVVPDNPKEVPSEEPGSSETKESSPRKKKIRKKKKKENHEMKVFIPGPRAAQYTTAVAAPVMVSPAEEARRESTFRSLEGLVAHVDVNYDDKSPVEGPPHLDDDDSDDDPDTPRANPVVVVTSRTPPSSSQSEPIRRTSPDTTNRRRTSSPGSRSEERRRPKGQASDVVASP